MTAENSIKTASTKTISTKELSTKELSTKELSSKEPSAEQLSAKALEDISSRTLAELMSGGILTVYEGWSIKRLAGFFVKHNISGAPVVASDDTLVGVVTQSDVIRFESKSPSDAEIRKVVQFYYGPNTSGLTEADIRQLKEKAIETCTVNAIMTPSVKSLDVSTSAAEACRYMVEQDLHRLFVTSHGRVVGVVTAMDFLRRMVET